MNKPMILIVEDDAAVRNLISTTLKMKNYKFHVATTGSQALLEAVSNQPDIMLLDLGLPDMDGVEIITKVRSWSNMPIIVISARCEDRDKIEALDAGADDYITKPFSVEEFLARLRVTIRRINYVQTPHKENSIFVKGNIKSAITDEDVLSVWKEFFSKNKNWKDFASDMTYDKYLKITDKQHLAKAKSMPIKYLKASGKGFFVEKEGFALALNENLNEIIKNKVFVDNMKDVLEYRTIEYYRRRYNKILNM